MIKIKVTTSSKNTVKSCNIISRRRTGVGNDETALSDIIMYNSETSFETCFIKFKFSACLLIQQNTRSDVGFLGVKKKAASTLVLHRGLRHCSTNLLETQGFKQWVFIGHRVTFGGACSLLVAQ